MKPEIRELLNTQWRGRTSGQFIDAGAGAPELESVIVHFQSMLDALHDAWSLRKPIEFSLYRDEHFNAFVDKFNGIYFIGLNTGTCRSFLSLFNTMLANPAIFPEVGNAHLEKAPVTSFRSIADFFPVAADAPHSRVPIDESRQRFAQVLYRFALQAVVLHEMAHITNGHIDWKVSKTGKTPFFELDDLLDGIPSVQHHALERDADACALSWGSSLIRKDPNLYAHESLNTTQARIWFYAFAYSMVWRAVNQHFWNIDKIAGKHPPKPVRLLLGLSSFYDFLAAKPDYGFSKDEALKLVLTVTVTTEDVAAKLVDGCEILDGLRGALHDETNKRTEEYVTTWRQMRTELIPHAWVPIAE